MKSLSPGLAFFIVSFLLSSCEFKCELGKTSDKKQDGSATVVNNGPMLYNGIKLTAHDIKVIKAYLIFENGDRVPTTNIIDLNSTIKIMIEIDSGWVVNNGRVLLGVSEKIATQSGEVLMDKDDLLKDTFQGFSAEDAKVIGVSAFFHLKQGLPPRTFVISFKVWDKKGTGYVEGNYRLFTN